MTRKKTPAQLIAGATIEVIPVTRYRFTFDSADMFMNVRSVDVIGGNIGEVDDFGASPKLRAAMIAEVERREKARTA